MANRQALRELQDRLAQRLQIARTQGVGEAWLAVECAGTKHLIPLAQAGEIFPFTQPQMVPYTAPWFLGVSNLRGGLYSVVDFAAFANDKPRSLGSDFRRSEMRLVALNPLLETNCAIVIDKLLGLRNREAFSSVLEREPQAAQWVGHTLVDTAGETWVELDVQRLAQSPRFLSVGI
jgi:twitching motility protein PilI